MKEKINRAGLSVRIWLIGLLLNTAIGTILLTAAGGFELLFHLLFFGTLFGLAVSFPAPFVLFLLFDRCVARKVSAQWMLRMALIGAVGCGVIAWLLFVAFFGGMDEMGLMFLALAIASGVFATVMQRSSIRRLASYPETIEAFLS